MPSRPPVGEVRPTILVAPGPYKECLSAHAVARAMHIGICDILPSAKVLLRPLSDGGSGIAELLVEAGSGQMIDLDIFGPLGTPIRARYGLLQGGSTAVVESATACGLALVPKDQRRPLSSSSFGVGQLIRHAVEVSGATRVVVGCGDSATNDCGIGMAAAMGVKFAGLPADARPGGGDLTRITGIDSSGLSSALLRSEVVVACNLTSILCGPEGTSRIYGPQKGATPSDVDELERGVEHFAQLALRDLGLDLAFLPGAGGSGGLAASLYAFLPATLRYSLDVVGRFLKLDDLLSVASLVVTGEGMIDDRTATGKVACGLALKAKRFGLPVVAIVGAISPDHEDIYYNGIDVVASIQEGPLSYEESMRDAAPLITRATARVMRSIFRLRSRSVAAS